MEYRRLGKSGLQFSALSLGSWLTFGKQIGDKVAGDLMKQAYDNGVNFFDNAEVYAKGQSEIVMGRILKKMKWDRSTWVVSSKVYWGGDKPNQNGLSMKHVMEGCHGALKRLQVEYLDLLFCHRPDNNTPMEETVRAIDVLIRQGKILYWGTSEWSAQQVTEAFQVARQYNLTPPSMEQPQYNMFHRERFEVEYGRLFSVYGYGATIWSPLASGLLTGKYNKKFPAGTRAGMQGMEWMKERMTNRAAREQIKKVGKLISLAGDIGTTMPKLAIAWCLKNPSVSTVILGASKTSQLKENLGALATVKLLTAEVMEAIEKTLDNRPQEPTL